ncbi:hypothetical protein OEZ85_006651 [Tetradesmus obliquus]|uniref:Plastid lipid-associated protein/fibrillin conserved domain-containing protein n=1 Tax=Tetradesmus obliquus TaxID=3088 RepID=A0ABY8TXE0_TETOB|nr:hypothetical protein OEZ85_006651 [Tetradesmus obliquus]
MLSPAAPAVRSFGSTTSQACSSRSAYVRTTWRRSQLCHVSSRTKPGPTAPAPTPPELSKDEQQSLQAVLTANNLSNVPGQLSAELKERVLSTIKAGLRKEAKDLQELEGCMLLAEQLHYMGTQLVPSAPMPTGVDMWQPIFASSGGFPRLLYIPVPEYFDMHRSLPDATAISFDADTASIDVSSSRPFPDGTLNIVTELGPLTTHFLGSCCWLSPSQFSYCINSVRLDLGGSSFKFGLGPMKLQNVLSFFLVGRSLACARSQLGGTMLLAANPEAGGKYFEAW